MTAVTHPNACVAPRVTFDAAPRVIPDAASRVASDLYDVYEEAR
ncbi:hypothetical protein ACWCP6_12810 [Streptomyces sp. NPDC002004]